MLLFAWAVVVLAFFILSVQLFITILEFKLTTLAGFVLVPFALWSKTAFLAERVLGNVVLAGIKVMVLAVITGIGTTLFGQFTGALAGRQPGLADAMSLVLASIALFGLGIFGPGIAAGLASGAPQLGAGAAIGTVGGLAAGAMAGSAAAMGLARAGGAAGLSAIRAGASVGGKGRSTGEIIWLSAIRAGASVGSGAATSGRQGAWRATGGALPSASASPATGSGSSVPPWARRLQSEQRFRAHTHIAAQAVKEGDRPGHGANPDLHQREH